MRAETDVRCLKTASIRRAELGKMKKQTYKSTLSVIAVRGRV